MWELPSIWLRRWLSSLRWLVLRTRDTKPDQSMSEPSTPLPLIKPAPTQNPPAKPTKRRPASLLKSSKRRSPRKGN